MQVNQFIANINDLYKPPLNVNQISFYSEFLQRYTLNQLQELWDITVETHLRMSPPTIGELNKYAINVKPVYVINEEMRKAEELKQLTNQEIFSTDLGKLSLKQGWADSYRLVCKEKGIPRQTDDVILKFQKNKELADSSVSDLRGNDDIFSQALVKMRQGMVVKNENWSKRFAHLI